MFPRGGLSRRPAAAKVVSQQSYGLGREGTIRVSLFSWAGAAPALCRLAAAAGRPGREVVLGASTKGGAGRPCRAARPFLATPTVTRLSRPATTTPSPAPGQTAPAIETRLGLAAKQPPNHESHRQRADNGRPGMLFATRQCQKTRTVSFTASPRTTPPPRNPVPSSPSQTGRLPARGSAAPHRGKGKGKEQRPAAYMRSHAHTRLIPDPGGPPARTGWRAASSGARPPVWVNDAEHHGLQDSLIPGVANHPQALATLTLSRALACGRGGAGVSTLVSLPPGGRGCVACRGQLLVLAREGRAIGLDFAAGFWWNTWRVFRWLLGMRAVWGWWRPGPGVGVCRRCGQFVVYGAQAGFLAVAGSGRWASVRACFRTRFAGLLRGSCRVVA